MAKCQLQTDEKYRVLVFFYAVQMKFGIPIPVQIQLLKVFPHGIKDKIYFMILGVDRPTKINKKSSAESEPMFQPQNVPSLSLSSLPGQKSETQIWQKLCNC